MNVIDYFRIENMEKEVLLKFGILFRDSIKEFSTQVDRSLGYLDKIVLPMIMASKKEKSYNPFSEIIEKYVISILTRKLENEGYRLLPLGYGADLTMEYCDHILSIDIKTANLDNPSDFKRTINVGINQMTHTALLRIKRTDLPEPYYVYPTIPPYYRFPNGIVKYVLTYGLLFIYPPYRDLIEEIKTDYIRLRDFFVEKVVEALSPIIASKFGITNSEAMKLLKAKPSRGRYGKDELIAESLIRGVFIYKQECENLLEHLNVGIDGKRIVEEFNSKLKDFSEKLRERDVKPIAIIAIAIPNGLLSAKYIKKFVSGKNYARSARYHYEDGIFEVIKEKTGEEFSRVVFLDVNMKYIKELKKYFGNIFLLDYNLRRL